MSVYLMTEAVVHDVEAGHWGLPWPSEKPLTLVPQQVDVP